MSRHWGRPLKCADLSERIELLNLRAADLVVVVSRAMKMRSFLAAWPRPASWSTRTASMRIATARTSRVLTFDRGTVWTASSSSVSSGHSGRGTAPRRWRKPMSRFGDRIRRWPRASGCC